MYWPTGVLSAIGIGCVGIAILALRMSANNPGGPSPEFSVSSWLSEDSRPEGMRCRRNAIFVCFGRLRALAENSHIHLYLQSALESQSSSRYDKHSVVSSALLPLMRFRVSVFLLPGNADVFDSCHIDVSCQGASLRAMPHRNVFTYSDK